MGKPNKQGKGAGGGGANKALKALGIMKPKIKAVSHGSIVLMGSRAGLVMDKWVGGGWLRRSVGRFGRWIKD